MVTIWVVKETEGRFVVEKSSISVLSPDNLRSKHDAAIGNFGLPDYGGSMVGTVVYPRKPASFGCSRFDGDQPFKSNSSTPTILLLDRGGNFWLTLTLSLSLWLVGYLAVGLHDCNKLVFLLCFFKTCCVFYSVCLCHF